MNETETQRILVLGAGSWGTALALVLARNGHAVWLWSRDAEHVQRMQQQRHNEIYLKNQAFPENLQPIYELASIAPSVQVLIVVVPSQGFRETLIKLKPFISATIGVCWATKGIEYENGLLLHQVAETLLGQRDLAVLSGPSFAAEVAAGSPTAVTLAANSQRYAQFLGTLFHNHYFRPYTSSDLIGVQIGGAVKNIMAIAAGVSDGLGFGANARTALITRGLAEMVRLGIALEGEMETFMGLAGLGDLVLTCTDNQSRNRQFGQALAQGQEQVQARKAIGHVVEGVYATQVVYRLAQQYQLDMPIVTAVYQLLQKQLTPKEAVQSLLSREMKSESVFRQ